MRTLTIFRHAKSSWDIKDQPDRDRPLNERGERDAPLMGNRVRTLRIRPSLIVSSDAERAWQTARIVAQQIAYPAEFLQRDKRLYLANLRTLLDVVAELDDGFNSVLLVGHNPGLTELANLLVPGITRNLPTAGFVSVLVDCDQWNIRARRSAKRLAYEYPKIALRSESESESESN